MDYFTGADTLVQAIARLVAQGPPYWTVGGLGLTRFDGQVG